MENKELIRFLQEKNLSVKKRFLQMYYVAKAGHIGSSLSCAEILTFVRLGWMQGDDQLVLSKGHAAAALYSVLAEAGDIAEDQIASFYKNNTLLSALPPVNKLKGVPFATGSLGHGLSLAAGLGMAGKLKKNDNKVFCITSDGEINEGSTWEAALFIVSHQLKNVVWFIDRNRLQGFGTTEEVMQLEPLEDKLIAFGFETMQINGHDFQAALQVKEHYPHITKPLAVICNTIKGNGWEDMQDTLDCHYLPFKENQYEKIIHNLEQSSGQQAL